jgi:hypothetical protein
MNIQKITESAWFMKTLIAVGLFLAALIIFQAGVYVGVRKASLSFRMGDNYYRALGPGEFPGGALGEELSEADGASGKILSVTLPTFVVEDRNGEKVILLNDQTGIRFMRDSTSSSAIMPGDGAIVIGEPDDKGEIQATFIRLLPPPPPQP